MKILLIAGHDPAALLDIQCVIQRLHHKHRQCRISLMAPEALQTLARRLEGLDDLLVLPDADAPFKLFWIAGRQLEEWQKTHQPFDLALVFTRRWKPALIPWMGGIARRSGQLGRLRFNLLNDARWMTRSAFPTRQSRYLALADDHGEMPDTLYQPRLQTDAEAGQVLLRQHFIDPERPVITLCPSAITDAAPHWPARHWATLAAQLIDQGWQIWLIAPAAEQPFCEQICAQLDRERQMEVSNLCGRLAWDDTLDLMALSRAVVAQQPLFSAFAGALEQPLIRLQADGTLQVQHQDEQQALHSSPQKTLSHRQPLQAPAGAGAAAAAAPGCDHKGCPGYRSPEHSCIHQLSVDQVRSALLSMVPQLALD